VDNLQEGGDELLEHAGQALIIYFNVPGEKAIDYVIYLEVAIAAALMINDFVRNDLLRLLLWCLLLWHLCVYSGRSERDTMAEYW
jgi:hypothetical protein